MKTIEQAQNEHCLYKDGDGFSFRAGAEFAQRWIPVEEELPDSNIDVIAKSGTMYWIARLQPNGRGLTLYSIKGTVINLDFEATHWRPIELK